MAEHGLDKVETSLTRYDTNQGRNLLALEISNPDGVVVRPLRFSQRSPTGLTFFDSSASVLRTLNRNQPTRRVDSDSSSPPLASSPSPRPSPSPNPHLPPNPPSTNSSPTSPRSPSCPASFQETLSLRQFSVAIPISRSTPSWTSSESLPSPLSTRTPLPTLPQPTQSIPPIQPSEQPTTSPSPPSQSASTTSLRGSRRNRRVG